MIFAPRAVLWAAAMLIAGALVAPAQAQTKVRISEQFGIHYLPLQIMVDQRLIEKHAAALGAGPVQVEMVKISGGANMNAALLSGNIDFAAGGPAPLLNLWEKTKGRQNVRAVGAVVSLPMLLNTNQPNVRRIEDFNERTRIAVPAVQGSIQAVVLQMAAKKAFGDARRLDPFTVSMAHPDAMAALLSGSDVIAAHFAVSPFSERELERPGIRTVLNSYDVAGGPHTQIALYNTEPWRKANPKAFEAVALALEEAMGIVNRDREAAGRFWIAYEKSALPPALVSKILADPNLRFTTTPENVMVFADFMHEVGLIKEKPASWKELFWENVHAKAGS
jgi:NitT/TauT family transport system substrate-binding protein